MEKWGLGYDELCPLKPDVILFSTSMLGRGGPYSRQPGFGPVLSSLSGMTGLTGWPDRAPTNPYGAYTDFVVPRFALPTIIAALDYRRRTGRGQHLDMAQLEVGAVFYGAADAPVYVEWPRATARWQSPCQRQHRTGRTPVRVRTAGAPLPV